MITGIKTFCIYKIFYLNCRDSNDTKFKECYKLYWKILSKVIQVAKKKNYSMIK